MGIQIFAGEPPTRMKLWIIEHYASAEDTNMQFTVQTTADYKKSGIYQAQRDDMTKPVVIDWGDGTVEQVDGDVSQKVHEYATVGTFEATISNVKTFAASANNFTWYNTTSQNAYTLKEVVLDSSVTSIGKYAFNYCTGLASVTIGDSVTSIGNYAFWGCSGLTSVTIGDSVTSIGNSVFYGCSGLTSITIPSSVTSISGAAFRDCNSLTSVTILDSVTFIGDSAFSGCSGLTSVTIPDSVTSIGESVFWGCTNLESITLGNGLHSLSEYVFYNCPKLVEVVANGMTCEHVAANANSWDLGISPDGTTHLVVVYCSDGVVVINDADSSSGELAPTINWEKFSEMLEDYPNMVAMPAVGSSLNVKYKVDVDADFVDTEWQILGYNKSIPEYVKYKNGSERIFVRSVEEDQNSANYQLLKSGFVNSPIYSRSDDGTYAVITGKTVASVGSGTFTYGNNCTYSVPTSIVVDGTIYAFAGYNVTLAPKYLLPVKNNGDLLYHQQFDSGRGYSNWGQNDWSTSMSRSWFNDNWTAIQDRCASQNWQDESWGNDQTCAIKGMVDRVETGASSFFSHVMPTVNRTWTFKYDSASDGSQYDLRYRKDKLGNNITSSSAGYDVTKAKPDGKKYLDNTFCEHCIDKFWLLGVGNVNCSGSNTSTYYKDGQYDTSKYDEVFNQTDVWESEPSRIRYLMKEDGKKMKVARYWRLRSAFSNTSYDDISRSVGYVIGNGDVYYTSAYITYGGALLPACTIC